MKVRPFRSIGGLTLHTYDPDQAEYGHGNVMMRIPREALSLVAVEAIREIGMDASEELIRVCREVIDAVDRQTADMETPAWRTLIPSMQEELWGTEYEEIRDAAKEIAIEELDKRSIQVLAEDWILGHKEDDSEPTAEEIQEWIERWVVPEPDEHQLYEVMEAIRVNGITFSSLAASRATDLIAIGDWLTITNFISEEGQITPTGIEWMHNYEERAREAEE